MFKTCSSISAMHLCLLMLVEDNCHYSKVSLAQSCLNLGDPMDCSQTPLSMEFSRQEYWSGLPFPSPGDLPDRGSNSRLLCLVHWQAGSLPPVTPGEPIEYILRGASLVTSELDTTLFSLWHFDYGSCCLSRRTSE